MTWKHVVALALGAGVAVVGAVVPAAGPVLFPVASSIIAGSLGHMAQPQDK